MSVCEVWGCVHPFFIFSFNDLYGLCYYGTWPNKEELLSVILGVMFIERRILSVFLIEKVYSAGLVHESVWNVIICYFILFFHLFLLVGGWLLHSIAVGFVIHWHESAMDLHVFPILIPPPTSLSIPSLWVFPVHQPWALVSWIQPGLVICFTFDSILVSMLLSQTIPPSPSPTESKSLFCTSVSLFLFCI